MGVGELQGNKLSKAFDDVSLHGRVRTFVDGESGGGVGVEKEATALFDTGCLNFALQLGGDVNEFHVR